MQKPKNLYRVLFRRVEILTCQCKYLHIFINLLSVQIILVNFNSLVHINFPETL